MKQSLIGLLILIPYTLLSQDSFYKRSYDQVIFPATWHWASVNSQHLYTTSSFSFQDQLEAGARAFLLSIYQNDHEAVISSNANELVRTEKLEKALKTLEEFLTKNPREIITLLVDNQLPLDVLQAAFEKSEILKRLYIHPPKADWPEVEQMIGNGHNIVLFVKKYPLSAPAWMHNWRLYGRELHNETYEIPEMAQREALPFLLYYFQAEEGIEEGNNPTVQANSKFLENVVQVWSKSGKLPNFIAIRPFPKIYSCAELNRLIHLSGDVSRKEKEQRDIYWGNTIPALSSSNVNFPAHLGDDVKIIPHKPGFEFLPPVVEIQNLSKDTSLHFEAISMPLSQNIKGYYPFEKGFNDISRNRLQGRVFEGTPSIEIDPQRGNVLRLNGKSAVEIGKAEDYLLNAHSFTIALWLKVKNFEGNDEGIISTLRRNYREGLHLILRARKPYLGFHTNDTQGNTTIDSEQWYHIVWRYRADVEEQAIFVNGKPDAMSRDHPAFKGRENLILGMRKNAQLELDYFDGYVDDLMIWGRALGEHEIIALSQGEVPKIEGELWHYYVGGLCFLVLFIGGIYGGLKLRKRSKKPLLPIKNDIKDPEFKEMNTEDLEKVILPFSENGKGIFFFGHFRLLNADGEDVALHLSPKIRRIFLYIFLHQIRNKKGVSSEELERVFWKNLEEEKAGNNRRVSIRKLRACLEKIPEIKLASKGSLWFIEVSDDLYCDLTSLLTWIKKYTSNTDISIEDFSNFQQILTYPHFLEGLSSKELDEAYSWIGHQILDVCEKLLNVGELSRAERLWVLDLIIIYDPLHEEAIKEKIAYLISQNQVNTAKYLYKDFVHLYRETYGELPSESMETFFDGLA